MRAPDALARAVVVVAAVLAVLLGAATAVTTVLTAMAAGAVVHAAVRHRGRGAVDAALVGAGGLLVLLVMLGVGLDRAGLGLRPSTWAVTLGLVSLAVLAVQTRGGAAGPGVSVAPGLRWREAPWAVAAASVVVLALVVSVHSVRRLDVAPVAMSVGRVDGTQVAVLLTSGELAGPFELRTDSGDGNAVSYPLVTLRAGHPVMTTVALPRKGRYVITLNNPGQDAAVRSVTVDR